MNSPNSPRINLPPLNISTPKKQCPFAFDFDLKKSSFHAINICNTPKQPENISTIQTPNLRKNEFCVSPFLSMSLKDLENNSNVENGRLMPVLNNKFFRINEKSQKVSSHSQKKKYGKTINLESLKEIHEKETNLMRFEKHHVFKSCDFSNFKTDDLIKDHIAKCEKNSERKRSLIEEKLSANFNEETFNAFIKHFYERKMLKSPSLMKYFQGKNIEIIFNNIGKYIFSNTFSPKEENFASYEYLSEIHGRLDIENEDFDTYKGLFVMSMREKGFLEEEIHKFLVRIEHYRPYIVRPLKFNEISCRHESFNEFLNRVAINIKEDAMLSYLFEKTSKEDRMMKLKKLFNFLCIGYDCFEFHHHKNQFIEFFFQNQELNWQQCFELKNIVKNELIDLKSLNLHKDFKIFDSQLHQLHKFILLEPNNYCSEYSLDNSMLVSLFCHSLNGQKSLYKLFGGWSINRLQSHCKYMVEYLLESNKNPYKLCDLAPAHSGCVISNIDFDNMMICFTNCLAKLNTEKQEINKMRQKLEQTRKFISREPQIHEKIPNFTQIIDHFIENIYVYMFASSETKHFFKNSELNYVKYKQKLFFMKLLKNELDPVDLMDLEAVHLKMKIKPIHFQLFVKFAQESLAELYLKPNIVEFVIEKIEGLKDYICWEEK